jgi:hypothetical protein
VKDSSDMTIEEKVRILCGNGIRIDKVTKRVGNDLLMGAVHTEIDTGKSETSYNVCIKDFYTTHKDLWRC